MALAERFSFVEIAGWRPAVLTNAQGSYLSFTFHLLPECGCGDENAVFPMADRDRDLKKESGRKDTSKGSLPSFASLY